MKSKENSIQSFLLEDYNLVEANEILIYLEKRWDKDWKENPNRTKLQRMSFIVIKEFMVKCISDFHRVKNLKLLIDHHNYTPYQHEEDLLNKIGDLVCSFHSKMS